MGDVIELFDEYPIVFIEDKDGNAIGASLSTEKDMIEIYDQKNGNICIGIQSIDGMNSGAYISEHYAKELFLSLFSALWPGYLSEQAFYDEDQ